jgi:hypothetical protein
VDALATFDAVIPARCDGLRVTRGRSLREVLEWLELVAQRRDLRAFGRRRGGGIRGRLVLRGRLSPAGGPEGDEERQESPSEQRLIAPHFLTSLDRVAGMTSPDGMEPSFAIF